LPVLEHSVDGEAMGLSVARHTLATSRQTPENRHRIELL